MNRLSELPEKGRSGASSTRKRPLSPGAPLSSETLLSSDLPSESPLPTVTPGNTPKGKKKRTSSSKTSDPAPISPGNGGSTPQAFAQPGVSAFLNKLYSMVEDPSTDHLIRWAPDGASFIVERHEVFAKTVLPRFYKHNTFASFVRQLNMYDFHKVPHLQQGVLIADSEHEIWEFSNPNFQRGRPEALALVSRKRNKERDSLDPDGVTLERLIQDITTIKEHQMNISSDLHNLQQDSNILWQESLAAREKHQRHQNVMQKILQFLFLVFSGESTGNLPINSGMNQQQMNGPFMLGKDNEYISLVTNPQAAQELISPVAPSTPSRENKHVLPQLQTALIHEAASMIGMNYDPSKLAQEAMASVGSTPAAAAGAATSSSSTAGNADVGGATSGMPPFDTHPTASLHESSMEGDVEKFTQTLSTASRSAEAISQDIDELQVDIEALAANLGIDPAELSDIGSNEAVTDFTDDFSSMIAAATRQDKIQLYELSGGRFKPNRYDKSPRSQAALSMAGPSHTSGGISSAQTSPSLHSAAGSQPWPSQQLPQPQLQQQQQQQQKQSPSVSSFGDSSVLGAVSPLLSLLMSLRARYADATPEPSGAIPKDNQQPISPEAGDVPQGNATPSFAAGALPSGFDHRAFASAYQTAAQQVSLPPGTQFVPVAVPVPVPMPYDPTQGPPPTQNPMISPAFANLFGSGVNHGFGPSPYAREQNSNNNHSQQQDQQDLQQNQQNQQNQQQRHDFHRRQ